MKYVPQRYIPKSLSKKDKKKQRKELIKSRKAYKNKIYHTRKKVKSFKSKFSPHIQKALNMYKLKKFSLNNELVKKTKCKMVGLKKIFKKGMGAYFSSGSRPNQTPHSWAYARLASGITGGKASAVDYNILNENCSKNSKALKLAKKAYIKYKKGRMRVKQVKLKGGKWSKKYKKSINCKKPKGFSQRQYCKYGRKTKKKKIQKKRKTK